MAKSFPARPSLEQLKKQAKELLKNYKASDADTLARVRGNLPRLAGKSADEIASERFVLQDAQYVVAREYGFSTWDDLAGAIKTPFEALAQFSDREAQVLMREVDQKDLIVALKGASDAVCAKFLGNMSRRVKTFIVEEMEYLGPMPAEEIEAVQLRIIAQIVQLRERDRVVEWPPKPAAKKKVTPVKSKATKRELEQKARIDRTAQKRLAEMSYDEMHAVLFAMAETARREGILALDKFGDAAVDDYVKMAINLVVDGTEPALVADMMQTWMKSLLHEQQVKYQKVVEGMLSIQAGDNPRIVQHKVSLIY